MKRAEIIAQLKTLIIPGIIAGVMLIAVCVILLVWNSLKAGQPEQFAATRYGGGDITQVSAYFAAGTGLTYDQLRTTERTLGADDQTVVQSWSLSSQSLEAAPNEAVAKNTVKLDATAVGGEYFLFHPFPLKSGAYIQPDDLMRDRIVINKQAAWLLYGSNNIKGKHVTIRESLYIISGVVDDGNANACAYVPYEMLPADTKFPVYEAVLTNKFTGYALTALKAVTGFGGAALVENTSRFAIPQVWNVLLTFNDRVQQTNAISYPYWENRARVVENKLALLLLFGGLLLIWPIILIFMVVIKVINLIVNTIEISAAKAYRGY
ncbi:MAG: ABC transporter permease [Oscillospiraceae bacterium]|jgi:hypothetical protein|nr:ABC transporter permease [Oscillospiraceae bacterium]